MSQFVKDLGLRLRSDRKTQVIAGLVVIAVLFLVFADNTPRRRGAPRQTETVSGAGDTNERWTDLVTRFTGQINTLTQETTSLREEMATQKKTMAELEATTAEIFKKILERLSDIQNNQAVAVNNPTARTLPDVAAIDPVVDPDPELEGIGTSPVAVQPPAPPQKPRLAAIMPGDSVRVKLLAGVNAPTDGTPYPVVLKLLGSVMGPDGNTIPLGEARIIAAAQGSLTDSRVLFRITRLSIRLPNGRRKEFTIDGWIVGEDGIRGLSGVLIDPIGKAIGAAGLAGAFAGLGQGIAAANQQYTLYSNGTGTNSVDSSQIPAYAGGVALSSAALEWQQMIRTRVSQLVPVVQVLSGREATAVFSQSLAIPDLLEALDDESPAMVYTSLD
jgi:molybdopterin converting factor small subunit